MGKALMETMRVPEGGKSKRYRRIDFIVKLAHEPSRKRNAKFLTLYHELESHFERWISANASSKERKR